jgi:D-alanine-D-alanine ligase
MIESEFGFPSVIKPNDQGSTVGLTVCKNSSEVSDALELSFRFSAKTIIEEYIPGKELTVAILEDKALPVLEIKPKSGLYDYASKYTSGMSEYIVPAEIPAEVAEKMQEEALLAFNALGCEVYARADFRMNNKFETFCLEVNTLPGMTATSLVPKMAKAVGISFEQLIERIIHLSL